MILKLTTPTGFKHIIDTEGSILREYRHGSLVYSANRRLFVQETIEEIIQQIKEGGITNGTN